MSKFRLILTSTISIVLVAILLIGSTYSIFTTTEIDENSNVYTTGNLNITYTVSSSSVYFTDPTPTSIEDVDVIVPYRITVNNNGNVPYMFDVILNDTTASNPIDYQYIMTKVGYLTPKKLSNCPDNILKEDVIVPAGESVDIDVRVWLSDSIPNSQIGNSFYAKLAINGLAIYDDNEDINNDILSLNYLNTSTLSGFISTNDKTTIKSVSFVDYIDTSNASTKEDTTAVAQGMSLKPLTTTANNQIIQDVSQNGDARIMAWLEANETEGSYNLYIGSENPFFAKDLSGFFKGMTSLESVDFGNLDTSLTTNMRDMFYNCTSLTVLDLSNFDTSNVTTMYYMFYSCSSLTSLDLSNFNTNKVTYMSGMFRNCSGLTNLDLSNFDTSNVTGEWSGMSEMFMGCSSLKSLDLSNFDTGNITNMQTMFSGCSSLTSLDLSNFNTSNVTNMQSMFHGCESLISLDLSNFDTSNVTAMNYMFYNCSSCTNLDLSSFDTSNVTGMVQMFENCKKLAILYFNNADFSSVTSYNKIFSSVPTTITIYVKDEIQANWITTKYSNLTNVIY